MELEQGKDEDRHQRNPEFAPPPEIRSSDVSTDPPRHTGANSSIGTPSGGGGSYSCIKRRSKYQSCAGERESGRSGGRASYRRKIGTTHSAGGVASIAIRRAY